MIPFPTRVLLAVRHAHHLITRTPLVRNLQANVYRDNAQGVPYRLEIIASSAPRTRIVIMTLVYSVHMGRTRTGDRLHAIHDTIVSV